MKTFLRIISLLAGSFLGLVGIFGFVTESDNIKGGGFGIAIFTMAVSAALLYFALHRSPEEKAERSARREIERTKIEMGRAGRRAYAQAQAAQRASEKEERQRQKMPVRPVAPGTVTAITDDETRVYCPAWVVLDVETTGLDPQNDRIIEFAARRYKDGIIDSEYSTFVNPGMKLPGNITELTGITDRDLRNAPAFRRIAAEILCFIDGLPVVAHNAKFDSEFLANECARAGVSLDINYIDTVRMARWAFPGLENYKLETLIRELSLLDHDQDHRAMSDVAATAKLYLLCREDRAKRLELEKRSREERAAREKEEAETAARNYVPESSKRAVDLYNLGSQYEREGKIDLAMTMYSQSVAEGVQLLQPYRRLAVNYRKQKDFNSEIMVCRAAIETISRRGVDQQRKKEEFEKRIAVAEEKLRKASST